MGRTKSRGHRPALPAHIPTVEEDRAAFRRRLRELRGVDGRSQEKLGAQYGVSARTWWNWENAATGITHEHVTQLANGFKSGDRRTFILSETTG